MNNEEVIQSWREGKKGKSGNGNLSTDGINLFSYNMLIGVTESGQVHKAITGFKDKTNIKGKIYYSNYKYSLDVTSPNFYSVTTSHHCSLAHRYSDEIIKPEKMKIGYGVWYHFPRKLLDKVAD